MSSECRCGSARLGRIARPRLPSDSRGRAEMCGHRLIQRKVLLFFLFSAVNRCESSGSRRTDDARQVEGTPQFCELVVDFGEEGPDGAPGETTRPACCEMAPQAATIRGRGQSQSPITFPPLKLPEKGCHLINCHSHRTRSCRSQLRRDADRVG